MKLHIKQQIINKNSSVRNSLDIHTTEIPTASGLCGSVIERKSINGGENRPGIEMKNALIFFSMSSIVYTGF